MKISNMIQQMTLEEKVGQMCVAMLQSDRIGKEIVTAVTKRYAGMVRYCPNAEFDNLSEVVGRPNRFFTPVQTAAFLNQLQALTEKTPQKIPLFVAVDQEGSTRNDVNRAGAFAYGGHMAFGAADDLELTYAVAKAAGEEFRAMGINLVQAPIVDVLRYQGRRTMKAATFGEDAAKVGAHAQAMMQGYQDGGVASMAKHFPGYGSVSTDAHKGTAEITKPLEAFEREDVAPMAKLIRHGLGGIMTGHAVVRCLDEEHPATLSKKVIQSYLRDELEFDGMVETDAMRMSAIQQRYGTAQASVMAVQAGCDLILLRGNLAHFEEGYQAVLKAVRKGEISEARIDQSVRRILREKERIGLLEPAEGRPVRGGATALADGQRAMELVGCRQHRELAEELAEQSVSVLRRKQIPILPDQPIRILAVSPAPQKIAAAQDPVQSPDMLLKAVAEQYEDTIGILTLLEPTEEEIEAAVFESADNDMIVLGLCNAILCPRQTLMAKRLFETGKPVIAIAMDSPYDAELVPFIEDVVCTYGVSFDAMRAAARCIAGKLAGRAIPPVTIHETVIKDKENETC